MTIPLDEAERLGLAEGQTVVIEIRPAEMGPPLAADLRDAFEIESNRGQSALRYLADH